MTAVAERPARLGGLRFAPSAIEDDETRELFVQMYAATTERDEIAAAFNVCEETVRRWATRLGLRESTPIRRLVLNRRELHDALDGIPATWNAEGSEFKVLSYRKRMARLPNHEHNTLEWKRVWHEIRKNPELLELHRELAPKGTDKTKRD